MTPLHSIVTYLLLHSHGNKGCTCMYVPSVPVPLEQAEAVVQVELLVAGLRAGCSRHSQSDDSIRPTGLGSGLEFLLLLHPSVGVAAVVLLQLKDKRNYDASLGLKTFYFKQYRNLASSPGSPSVRCVIIH